MTKGFASPFGFIPEGSKDPPEGSKDPPEGSKDPPEGYSPIICVVTLTRPELQDGYTSRSLRIVREGFLVHCFRSFHIILFTHVDEVSSFSWEFLKVTLRHRGGIQQLTHFALLDVKSVLQQHGSPGTEQGLSTVGSDERLGLVVICSRFVSLGHDLLFFYKVFWIFQFFFDLNTQGTLRNT